jgi:hypothetical protein
VGNKSRELWGHTSSSVAYYKIACEEIWNKCHLGIIYHLNNKANVNADCLENQFTSHDLSDKNHEWQVETTVQALLTFADNTPLGKLRPCDAHKLVHSLKSRKACGLDGIPNKCLKHLPRWPLVYLTHLLNHCLPLCHFPKPWKKAKVCKVTETQDVNSPKMYVQLAPCPQQANYWRKLFLK